MNDGGKIAIVAIGVIVAALLLPKRTEAAGEYICPVDGLEFPSQAELEAHMEAEHPGVRIPLYIRWD